MTLLSRITGLVRESLKATVFGAGVQMDAFEAAFRLPNILRRMFAEGAFSQAFVPILSEYHRQRGADATRDLVGRVGSLLAFVLLGVTVLGVLAAPWLVYLLAAGFAPTPGKVELTAQMIRIVFPYILFVSLVSLAGGVLNVYRRFAIPAFTPVLLNLSVIGAAIFLSRYFDPPILALAWGVFIGGVAQLAFQIAPLARLGMLPRLALRLARRGRAARAAAHGAGGDRRVGGADLGAHQHAARGGARRRTHLLDHLRGPPDGVSERAAGRRDRHRAPAVARAASQRRRPRRVLGAARLGAAPRVPARAARRVRAVAAGRAARSRRSTSTGSSACTTCGRPARRCSATASGSSALILVKILAPGFYARQHMRTPVRIAFFTVLVSLTLAVILMRPLGHAGLTLATSLGACVNAGLLFWSCAATASTGLAPAGCRSSSKLLVALGVLAAVLYALAGPADVLDRGRLWRARRAACRA